MMQYIELALGLSPILGIGLFVWLLTKTKKILSWIFFLYLGSCVISHLAFDPKEIYEFTCNAAIGFIDPDTAGHWVIFNDGDPVIISHNWAALAIFLTLIFLFIRFVRK